MLSDRSIATLLTQPVFVGLLLRDAIRLEHALDQTLALYFLRSERLEVGMDLLLPSLMASRKIDLLAKLPLPRRSKSRKEALAGLRRFNELRNLIAHNHVIKATRVRALLKDPAKRAMFAALPGIERDAVRTLRALERLSQTHAFGPDARSRAEQLFTAYLYSYMAETDSRVSHAIDELLRRKLLT